MPGRTSSFIALTTAAVLLLTSIPVDRAAAEHDIKELWNKKQESCQKVRNAGLKEASINNQINRYTKQYRDLGCMDYKSRKDMFENEACLNLYYKLSGLKSALFNHQSYKKGWEKDCATDEAAYQTALTEVVTAAAAEPPDPEGIGQSVRKPPTITVKKPPPRKRRRGPVKTTRRPQRGHSEDASYTAQALIFLGLSAINKYTTKKPPRRSGGGGGQRSSGGGGGVKSPGGGGYVHSEAASTHQDRIRRGM